MEGKQLKLFKVRDMRQKEKFVVDDIYLNGYAKVLGPTYSAIYFSLCRHANKEQEAFPARERIADQWGVSVATVKRAIGALRSANIIMVDQAKMRGKWLNNIYILLDKSEWKKVEDIAVGHPRPAALRGSSELFSVGHPRPIKDTHGRKHINMSPVATEWILKDEIQKLKKDIRRHIQVIGVYAEAVELKPENHQQMESIILRNCRVAKLLKGYSNEDIAATIETMKATEYLKKFTLETVTKFIDNIVAQKKSSGPKIVSWQKIVKDGRDYMRPVYATK